ncbi:MAG TPA: hypothetical protein VLH86_04030 [Patescibacteria group bacterium]|nr:hypothetical protein [Patescibacteria group bacterium]
MTLPEQADFDPYSAQPPIDTWILNDAERRVADVFVPSPAVAEAQRPALRQVVDRALATAVSPHEQRSLILTGRILEWQLFDPIGPLPPGLVLSADEQGRSYISFDTREQLGGQCTHAATERLVELGLQDVIDVVKQDWNDRDPQIAAALDAMIRTTPEFALLQSFDIKMPDEVTEQPLLPHVRDEREQQILDHTRQTHHVPDWERISTKLDPAAAKTAGRGIQYLDEQTMPRRAETRSDDDARQRAKNYFAPTIAEEVRAEFDEAFVGTYQWRNGELWLVTQETPAGQEATIVMDGVADKVVEKLDNTSPTAKLALRSLVIEGMFERLFDPNDTTPYAELLEQTIATVAQQVYDYPHMNLGYHHFSEHDDHVQLYRHAPTGEFVHRDTIDDYEAAHAVCDFYLAGNNPTFGSRHQIEEEARPNVGIVNPNYPDTGVGRLVQTQPYNPNLDTYEPDVDLEVSLWDPQFERNGADPFIPGYRLAYRAGSHYGFYRDPDGDPYAQPNIPLTPEQQAKLQDIASRLGMTGLATAAAANPNLTVEDLRQLLEDNTFYAYRGEGIDLPHFLEVNTIDDFAAIVAPDGRMPQQCSATIWFQKTLLEELFGRGSAATTGGLVISGDGTVRTLRHGQTVFIHEGKRYILEAQPQVEADGTPLANGVATGRADGTQRDAPPQFSLAEVAPQPQIEPSMVYDPEAQRERQLEAAFDTLEAQLSVLFRIPDREALKDRLLRLSPDDPIRRAYEFAWRAAMLGDVTDEEAAALARYLDLYGRASPALRKEAGVPSYDPRIVSQLTTAVDSVGVAVTALREVSPSSGGGAAERAGGGMDIAGVRGAIESALALLPGEELVIARDGLVGAIARLRDSLSGSDNPAAAAAIAQLDAAQAALDRAGEHASDARDSSQRYLNGL